MNRQITLLVPSWKGAHLLKSFLPQVKSSFRAETRLVLILNEADDESKLLCEKNEVNFIAAKDNLGTLAVDLFIPFLDTEFVCNANSDMYFKPGWDIDMMDIVERNGPCSASCFLVEPFDSPNPIKLVDDLGPFEEASYFFDLNCSMGKYDNIMPRKVSYSHPITVRTSDFLAVGGYSNFMDWGYWPGGTLDEDFAFRLWYKYNGRFKFITSDRSCVYHGGRMTMNKHPENIRNKSNDDYFHHKRRMTNYQFREMIGVGNLI